MKCPVRESKNHIPMPMIKNAIESIRQEKIKKPNCIWLEASGCFGQIISLLNGEDPDAMYFLKEMVNVTFFSSIMADQGEYAYERILKTLESDGDLILIVSGAIPLKENCAIVATYKGEKISALKLLKTIAPKAKYIIAVGTCASFGGPTAARPNLSRAVDVSTALRDKNVIRVPGCPTNPVWILGTIGYILSFGKPELDNQQRPVTFYGITIHDNCERRYYFDNEVFATKFGDKECMFKLGCRGPITKTLCPVNRWNQSDNWPIGDNTTCIGCAAKGFPDDMEPFVRF
ncbi:Ni/Fe hydrogenase [Romboutsia maritimum]|uniref:Ni/Fe hydrogenase n=1 Tax=Romboutsia maritimum TaxID=2020948 RepID=A0A371IRN8_9FIRM|nr:hydrogenase small subunit [Romboutsia maritimum]RDY23135.1 Ni/Fe hydrogenase [Romboutsia maritimum]